MLSYGTESSGTSLIGLLQECPDEGAIVRGCGRFSLTFARFALIRSDIMPPSLTILLSGLYQRP